MKKRKSKGKKCNHQEEVLTTDVRSDCCNYYVSVSEGKEGTNCYTCDNCDKACDVKEEAKKHRKPFADYKEESRKKALGNMGNLKGIKTIQQAFFDEVRDKMCETIWRELGSEAFFIETEKMRKCVDKIMQILGEYEIYPFDSLTSKERTV